jgi:hypothetical protein
MTMEIERVSGLTRDAFVEGYLAPAKPVIVTDATADWELARTWTPDYLRKVYGASQVQVYNNYFDLRDVTTLDKYLTKYFGRETVTGSVPYVRWYSKMKDVDFVWSDREFDSFKTQWSLPAFIPDRDYLFPFCMSPDRIDPTVDYFPARGVFISGKGGKTALHVDPWASDAVLIQVYGEKQWFMYDPQQRELLTNGTKLVDIEKPDPAKFPAFSRAKPTYTFTLRPGELMYVPRGWFHHVNTLTDSISLTWNFVHSVAERDFMSYLDAGIPADDRDIVRFFTQKLLRSSPSPDEGDRVRQLRSKLETALAATR